MAKAITKDQLSDCLDRISDIFTSVSENFTGATSSTAGESGMVPQPAAGDNEKFLRGDGTWASPTLAEIVISSTQPSSTTAIWIKPN